MKIFILLKYVAVLMAAVVLGRWFDKVRRMALTKRMPWYTPWISAPGITIIVIFVMLIIIRIWVTQ